MKRFFGLFIVFCVSFIFFQCNMSSQGDSLEPLLNEAEASIGKTFIITLTQINIEINSTGLYLRAFDKKYKAIFIYFDSSMKNKVANLVRDQQYIYKFKVTKNDKNSTLSGKLLEIGDLSGKYINDKLIDTAISVKTIRLDGKDATMKKYTVPLVLDKMEKYVAYFRSPDKYQFLVNCTYKDDLAKEMQKLKQSTQYTIEMEVIRNDIAIEGSLIAVK